MLLSESLWNFVDGNTEIILNYEYVVYDFSHYYQ